MADTLKRLYRNTLGTVNATLYTTPANTKTIVTEIVLSNKSAAAATVTITAGGFSLLTGKSVPANDTLYIKCNTVLEAGEILAGLAGTAAAIDAHISGVEVA